MKNIDPKSVLIGVLATALVIGLIWKWNAGPNGERNSSKPTSIIPEAKAAAAGTQPKLTETRPMAGMGGMKKAKL